MNVQCGKYLHYKNKYYEVIGVVRHSETCEELVLYKALFTCEQYGDQQLWVRPRDMFFENITHNGQIVPRFKWVGDVEPSIVC